jgi:hypothetical protein
MRSFSREITGEAIPLPYDANWLCINLGCPLQQQQHPATPAIPKHILTLTPPCNTPTPSATLQHPLQHSNTLCNTTTPSATLQHPLQHATIPTRDVANWCCKQVLPTSVADKCCRQMLPTNFVNRFCQQVLPTGFANRFCQQVLPTAFANSFCQQLLPTAFANSFFLEVNARSPVVMIT